MYAIRSYYECASRDRDRLLVRVDGPARASLCFALHEHAVLDRRASRLMAIEADGTAVASFVLVALSREAVLEHAVAHGDDRVLGVDGTAVVSHCRGVPERESYNFV